MNILNNRNKRTSIFKAVALCLIAAVSFTLVSCDDDMDIQQSYPFTVEVFGNSFELEFDFNNRNVKDDGLTIVPIGNFSPLLK